VFLEKRWPDFTVSDLQAAVEEFSRRERTRGSLPQDGVSQRI
jgi:undecaprenyl pyrophosphate synthase